MMNLKVIQLDDKEFYVIQVLELDKHNYYILINTEDNSDFRVRKEIIEDNEKVLVGLDSEKEFMAVMEKYDLTGFLPIGTVCKVKGYKDIVMITGYFMSDEKDRTKVHEYCGCKYPMGVMDTESYTVFNRKDIEKVYELGYRDDTFILLKTKLFYLRKTKLVEEGDAL